MNNKFSDIFKNTFLNIKMNVWILLLGVTLLIIGIFLATIGGIEKFSLKREDTLWLVIFLVGILIILFSLVFILYAYIVDTKSRKMISSDSPFLTIRVPWPTNLLNTSKETKVVEVKPEILGSFVPTKLSEPLI